MIIFLCSGIRAFEIEKRILFKIIVWCFLVDFGYFLIFHGAVVH